ncbi:response regulator [Marivita sp. S0852]|uniref:response regulator n=1 Tax=Marivita sp. S0852 TaxID=3373893 RepID=UPI0039829D03
MAAPKILLLEDEAIIAMDMELTLEARGYAVLGPCRSLSEARKVLKTNRPDLALLDVNLGRDEHSLPVALELQEMGVPIVFLTGYSPEIMDMPDPLKSAKRLAKPVNEQDLMQTLEQILSTSAK